MEEEKGVAKGGKKEREGGREGGREGFTNLQARGADGGPESGMTRIAETAPFPEGGREGGRGES